MKTLKETKPKQPKVAKVKVAKPKEIKPVEVSPQPEIKVMEEPVITQPQEIVVDIPKQLKEEFKKEKPAKFAKLRRLVADKKYLFIAIVAIIVIAALSAFFYTRWTHNRGQQSNAQLLKQIGKLIELPKDESPTIAVVSDVSKLQDQAFFANAQNGDSVLVYSLAKKAILFRRSANKVIEVATIESSASVTPVETKAAEPAEEKPAVVKVAVLNGTKIAGYAATTATKIQQSVENTQVILKTNANKDYTNTIVVDLRGNLQDVASSISSVVAGETGSLPEGETVSSDADILVILGE